MKTSEHAQPIVVNRGFGLLVFELMNSVSLLVIGLLFFETFGIESSGLVLLIILWTEAASYVTASILNGNVFGVQLLGWRKHLRTTLSIIFILGSLIALIYATSASQIGATYLSAITVYLVAEIFLSQYFYISSRTSALATYLRSSRYTLAAITYWVLIAAGLVTSGNLVIAIFAPFILIGFLRWSALMIIHGRRDRYKDSSSFASTGLGGPVGTVLKRIDVLIFPIFFDMHDTGIYLVARVFSTVPLPLFSFLLQKAQVLLKSQIRFQVGVDFIGTAARLNLGLFLIGGGISMIPLALGKIYVPIFGDNQQLFSFCLFFAVVSHYCKGLLGAGVEILSVTVKMSELVALISVPIVVFVGYCFYASSLTARDFALAVAVMHTSLAAVSAGIVAVRFGIWPGPTAIFFGQIRLFHRTKNSA
jgi:hypothetical protein